MHQRGGSETGRVNLAANKYKDNGVGWDGNEKRKERKGRSESTGWKL